MRKLVNGDDLINWWLEKYHNTNLEKVKKLHPEWDEAEQKYNELKINPKRFSEQERSVICKDMEEASTAFYKTYAVTQEQHDEWNEWAQEYTRKVTKLSKDSVKKGWWSVYLNCSPSIKTDI